ncbi:MAG: 50S ribosomal protein L20 [Acholeplasmatales bacterium]|nr:50S ribosomal protein L20 [Acholeplasmatales bacterium]
MPRVKGGYTTRRRRKAVLKLAKGYYGSKHALYRTAHEQVMRSLAYAFRDRKQRKREFRKLWIQRINAACQLNGTKYSLFIAGLANAGIEINRKMLAEMAVNDAEGFAALVKTALAAPKKAVAAEKVVVLKKATKAEKQAAAAQAKPAKKAAAKKAEAPKAAAPKAEASEDLSKKTVAELKAIAAEKGVKIPSGAKKADILDLLK